MWSACRRGPTTSSSPGRTRSSSSSVQGRKGSAAPWSSSPTRLARQAGASSRRHHRPTEVGRAREQRPPPRRAGPYPCIPAAGVARFPAPVQVPPDLLGLCGAGNRVLRHTARRRSGWLAPAALQSVQPWGLRPRFRPDALPLPAPDSRLAQALTVVLFANVLQPLIDFFEAFLLFFHDTVGMGWGASIVALRVVVRAALLPLTLKQFKSMQNMVKFQPEIKRLQERYKGDRERLNQEMMKFYRENKVNPFASCLPLVAQLPVFLA